MTVNSGERRRVARGRDRDAEEKLLDRFRDPGRSAEDPDRHAKLLTGFDAPILQAMYLDKPLRDHTLLQAICRTNRPYPRTRRHGLIVDYLGVFDDVAKALAFDEKASAGHHQHRRAEREAARGDAEVPRLLPRRRPHRSRATRASSPRRSASRQRDRDAFAASYSFLAQPGEALSPDPVLGPYRPTTAGSPRSTSRSSLRRATGKLIWHALGAKTNILLLLEGPPPRSRPEEGSRGRGQDHLPAAPARWRSPLRGARRAARAAARASPQGQLDEHRVPEAPARARQGGRAGRTRPSCPRRRSIAEGRR